MGLDIPIRHMPYFLPRRPEGEAGIRPTQRLRPYFLFVGRLEYIKGVHNLIETFRKNDQFDLLIAGDGSYRETLETQAKDCSNIRFLGPLSQDALADIYRSAIAVIVPSICYETFGIIVIEAFSHKTPVIVNDLGALPEVVEDSQGGFVYRNEDELIAAIKKLAADQTLRDELGEKGYQAYLEYWNEEPHLNQYLELIKAIKEQRKRGSNGTRKLEKANQQSLQKTSIRMSKKSSSNRLNERSEPVSISEMESPRVPIITYHSIDDSGSVVSTSPAAFQRQMKYLSNAGYTSLPLRELVSSLKEGRTLPSKPVVLTFDDGFKNFYTHAFPVLSEYGFSATVFLVTDFCGRHNDWDGNPPKLPRSELLSWPEIKVLNDAGIEFGSHTKTHPDLTKLTPAEAEAEIVESKAAIDDALSSETVTFAYPFGRHNAFIRGLAASNFDASCSVELGKVTLRSDFSSLERIDAYYLTKQRLLEMLPSATFDSYMSVRQTLRTVKAFVNGG